MATIAQIPATLDVVVVEGDDLTVTLTVTESGVAYNWTGATVATAILQDGTALATNFTVTTPVNGTLVLTLSDTDTSTLGPAIYRWWLSVTKTSTTRTFLAGDLSIMETGWGGTSTSTGTLSITNAGATINVTGQITGTIDASRTLVYSNAPAATDPYIQAVTDTSGTYGTGVVFGNAAGFGFSGTGTPLGIYGPLGYYHKFGDYTGLTTTPITKSTQGIFGIAAYYGPTTDDSAQSSSFSVLMKNTGTSYTQNKSVTAGEFGVYIENGVTVPSTSQTLGSGSRSTIWAGGSAYNVYGFKASAWTKNSKGTAYGTATFWKGFYDDIYNPAGTAFGNNLSVAATNLVQSEQGFALSRTSYGGFAQLLAHGSAYNGSMMVLQTPNPSTSTVVADATITSGSNLLTTATTVDQSWIGRVVTNANVPTGTQVLSYYGSAGSYTIVMNSAATGSGTSQSVTFAEPDLSALRINMASGSTGNAITVYDTSGTQRFVVSRFGIPRTAGVAMLVQNGSSQSTLAMNADGSVQPGSNISGTGAIGVRIWSGSGTPSKPGNVNPTAGDLYLRTDATLARGNIIYQCTTGGASPVWAPAAGNQTPPAHALQMGWQSWTYDPSFSTAATAPTSQTIYCVALPLTEGQIITNVLFDVTTAGAGTVPTGIYVGLCNATTMVAQSNNLNSSSAWTSNTTIGTAPLNAAYTVPTTGLYYAVLLVNGTWGTTQMTLQRITGARNTVGGLLMQATGGTGQTTLPANNSAITLVSTGSPLRYWAGVS